MTTNSFSSFATSQQRIRLKLNGWSLGTLAVAFLVGLPILWVISLAFSPSDGIWEHLANTILSQLVWTTLTLMTGVGIGTFAIGTATAWVVTMCRFPGRHFFEWALLVPMAVPAYVIAYVYSDLLEFSGPLQSFIRDFMGYQSRADYWFFEIRSLGGAIAMMTLVLYPYVYLLARTAFIEQSASVLEASRTLGKGPWQSFFKVALPLARPAIAVGVSLVMMETLNDYGTVDFFAVATFTTGIFDVWLNMNSQSGAAQLATALLVFVTVLVGLERYQRRCQKYHQPTTRNVPFSKFKLSGINAVLAFLTCAVPILCGFLVPAWVLTSYALNFYQDTLDANYWTITLNSLLLSGTAAFVAIILGLFLAYSLRLGRAPWLNIVVRIATFGYAVPGAVLAIGIVMFLGSIDHLLNPVAQNVFGFSNGLLLSGTLIAVIFSYVVRFLSLSFGTAESGLTKITKSMDGAARTLGAGPFSTLRRVHMPMLKSSLMTAVLLVFVDGMKELPMTTVLRPFDFETLATFVHQYASDELLAEASFGALTIVATGIIPVILLSRTMTKTQKHTDTTS